MELIYIAATLMLVPLTIMAYDYQIEYFKDISIECDLAKNNFSETGIAGRYWMLPDGRLVDQSAKDPRITVSDDYTLNISRVDDIDFGRYSCLLIFTNYTMASIEHGLNIDGPYFGDLLSKYKKNAMIGGIAAGSLFIVLAGGCLLWNFRFHKRSEKNKAVDALDEAINGYDLKTYDNVGLDTDASVTVYPTKGDESASM